MKTKLYSVITLLICMVLVFVSNGFTQQTLLEPSVRLIYFLPNDRPARPDRIEALPELIKDAQEFYANEMQRHGFGRKTFRIETDTDGKPVVHQLGGRFNENHYYERVTDFKVWQEVFEHFDDFQHVYFIAIDLSSERLGGGNSCGLGGNMFFPSNIDNPEFSFGSVATRHRDITPGEEILGGSAIIPASGDCFEDNSEQRHTLRVTTHELAHAFGLQHDFREGRDSDAVVGGTGFRLSKCAAEWLSVSRFFNTQRIRHNAEGKIQLLSTRTYNEDTISLRFQVTDPDGLHQAQLLVPEILKGTGWGPYRLFDCKRLNGKTSTVESTVRASEIVDRVTLQMMDVNGNITWATVPIELEAVVSEQNVLDINSDGIVNILDLIPIASRYGHRGVNPADINKDRIVNIVDVLLVAGNVFALPQQVVETFKATEVQKWLTDAKQLDIEDEYQRKGVVVLEYLLAEIAFLSTPRAAAGQSEAVFPGHTDIVWSVAFSSDGQTLASSSWDNKIRLWNAETKQHEITLIERSSIKTVAFSPDGQTLASGNWDKTVRLWDPSTGKLKRTLSGHREGIESVVFSPDGATLASGSVDGTIQLWDPSTRRIKRTLTGQGRMRSIAFSPDGATLASGSSDHTIQLWNPDTGKLKRTLTGHTDWVEGLAFSPDGNTLASGGGRSERTLRLWNPHNGQEIRKFTGYTGLVSGVAFSPDGQLLASGSWGRNVRLWNTETGKDENALEGHTGRVYSVAFSLDGRMLVSGGEDGTVRLWEITPFLSQQPIDDSDKIAISEIMVASKGGSLPQWIELHNRSNTHAVNLKGWKLEIQNYRSENFNGHQNITITLKEKSINPQETLLIVSKQGRSSNNFQNEQVYNLSNLHPNLQDVVLSKEGVYLKLSNAAGELIDEVGNLDGKRNTDDKPAWSLPKILTADGMRTSMIRRYDDRSPRLGTETSGWVSAINTKLATGTTQYYGHPLDIGAPGIGSGGALPVSLSRLRAELTDTGVIIKWVTESELDNAGFNILRSETKNGEFKSVNPQLIQGAGTTTERHTYTWTDTTAKPNTVYYYRIDDISHAGVHKQLATVRLRGLVSATGKLTTSWADLKTSR